MNPKPYLHLWISETKLPWIVEVGKFCLTSVDSWYWGSEWPFGTIGSNQKAKLPWMIEPKLPKI